MLTIQYRRKVLNHPISERLKTIFVRVGEKYNVFIEEWHHDQDHVHVLFKAHPNTHLSRFLNAYKSASSRVIKKEFPAIKKQYYGLSDAFFFPSRQETFGLVIPEAGGSSLPIVLRDLPVYKKIFGNHYLKGQDVDDFADQIKQLKDDPALYSEYANKAFDLFEQYTEDK